MTPMMRQYLEIKETCKDCILFFRLGDFYEMFFEDAETAARELELVLTGKDCGLPQRAPMCGVPYHAAISYISRLVSRGYKVAVCEQMEDPATAVGLVKRDIVKIYTPGTLTDEQMLESSSNNFIMSVYSWKGSYGVAAADISTGEMQCTSLTIGNTLTHLLDETAKFSPSEVIVNSGAPDREELGKRISSITGAYVSYADQETFEYSSALELVKPHISSQNKISEYDICVNAAGALLKYMEDTRKKGYLVGLVIVQCADHASRINAHCIKYRLSCAINLYRIIEDIPKHPFLLPFEFYRFFSIYDQVNQNPKRLQ